MIITGGSVQVLESQGYATVCLVKYPAIVTLSAVTVTISSMPGSPTPATPGLGMYVVGVYINLLAMYRRLVLYSHYATQIYIYIYHCA